MTLLIVSFAVFIGFDIKSPIFFTIGPIKPDIALNTVENTSKIFLTIGITADTTALITFRMTLIATERAGITALIMLVKTLITTLMTGINALMTGASAFPIVEISDIIGGANCLKARITTPRIGLSDDSRTLPRPLTAFLNVSDFV